MKKLHAIAVAAMVLGVYHSSRADVFNMGPGQKSLDTVAVGDPGNASDPRYGGYGAVSRAYKMAKYEITAAQYAQFLNAVARDDSHGVYNADMFYEPYACKIARIGTPGSYSYSVATEFANRPVNYVNYWDACRFANWLHNGQPTGLQDARTTEDGAYTLHGKVGDEPHLIPRNPGARWFLPNEDEFYKAAYYKAGNANAGYWEFPTKSDTINTGMANYAWSVKRMVDVGSYSYPGPYGTFDQGGNADEWIQVAMAGSKPWITLRGGGFFEGRDGYYLDASTRTKISIYPTFVYCDIGFRVGGAIAQP